MFRAARVVALLMLVGSAYMLLSEDPADWHVTGALGHGLCKKSAFVHGYIHGYEQGFHVADLDLQMGHDVSDPTKIKAYRDAVGYRGRFGDKAFFESGYHEGFRVGYADGVDGRAFRAVSELRAAALGVQEEGDLRPSKVFDQGFSSGYSAGVQHGLRDGRVGIAFQEVSAQCPEGLFHSLGRGDEYCSGYGRGYRLGYTDGYVNQAPEVLAQRK